MRDEGAEDWRAAAARCAPKWTSTQSARGFDEAPGGVNRPASRAPDRQRRNGRKYDSHEDSSLIYKFHQ
ncbi:hypothetical protein [Neoroseomonas soli]|uniref:Uncharacterized protein n=1 Tax=Neoroseomonas soli TaxID=1081025 RepID=A0A9X9WR84_9PROT|nr:hypothetical protein [Neoroseomonas soli]MBR0669663.1 hypothetical protein [Neoroseomonas soli]